MTNRTFAIDTAADAIPAKPNNPATRATMKKTNAQYNIALPSTAATQTKSDSNARTTQFSICAVFQLFERKEDEMHWTKRHSVTISSRCLTFARAID